MRDPVVNFGSFLEHCKPISILQHFGVVGAYEEEEVDDLDYALAYHLSRCLEEKGITGVTVSELVEWMDEYEG